MTNYMPVFKVYTDTTFDQRPQFTILPTFCHTDEKTKERKIVNSVWPKEVKEAFQATDNYRLFHGARGETFPLHVNGRYYYLIGFGDRNKLTSEDFRRDMSRIYHAAESKYETMAICLESFNLLKDHELSSSVIAEAFLLSSYRFDAYFSEKKTTKLKTIFFLLKDGRLKAKVEKGIQYIENICHSINLARHYINLPPNVLNSEVYAKKIDQDIKENLKGLGIKLKILGREELKKEKMGLFLSVNAGSSFEPRLIHLTYTPKKVTANTRHIALVGKGITFDTGGHSLKGGAFMVNMKFDMAGSATVYAAFRAAALNHSDCKITCLMGITDNAISPTATFPDAIIQARNGKYVEILNTDAEGRLVLADCLDYACDLKPDVIIDCATLTGAMKTALGNEIAGLFSNNDKMAKELLKSADAVDEYMWQMPIIKEFRDDMKSPNADYQNIAKVQTAGSSKAAAFLEFFVKDEIPWLHLDIAGIADAQNHLPYCNSKGGSGLMVRSIHHFIMNQ